MTHSIALADKGMDDGRNTRRCPASSYKMDE